MASRSLAPVARGTALQRATPLDPLLILQRDMDRLFGNIVRSIGAGQDDSEALLVPRVDVRETDSGLEIDAELPGVADKDVEVSVEDDALVLAGETRREKREEKSGYRLAERQIGRFRRVIQLPFEPDPEKIEAQVKNGLLAIRIPKPPEADRTRRIAVKAGQAETNSGADSAEPKEAKVAEAATA